MKRFLSILLVCTRSKVGFIVRSALFNSWSCFIDFTLSWFSHVSLWNDFRTFQRHPEAGVGAGGFSQTTYEEVFQLHLESEVALSNLILALETVPNSAQWLHTSAGSKSPSSRLVM